MEKILKNISFVCQIARYDGSWSKLSQKQNRKWNEGWKMEIRRRMEKL